MYNEEMYTNLFKKKLIINIMASLSAIILLAMIPFIKFFQICLTNGFEVFPEPILVLQSYSFFDFLKADSEANTSLIIGSIGFFLLLAILIGLIIKFIFNIYNIKKYSFEQYDFKKSNQGKLFRFNFKTMITSYLIAAIFSLFLIPIVRVCSGIASSFREATFDSVYYINAIDASIIAIGVFIIISFGLTCASSVVDCIINNKILKEKYDTVMNENKEN